MIMSNSKPALLNAQRQTVNEITAVCIIIYTAEVSMPILLRCLNHQTKNRCLDTGTKVQLKYLDSPPALPLLGTREMEHDAIRTPS